MNDKYEGNSKICTSCNSVITCRMSQYANIPNKLQWQNKDGGAHYKYKGEDEEGKGIFECVVSQKSESQKGERLTKHDLKQCPMCTEQFGWFKKTEMNKLKDHIKSYHPNSERLVPDDFRLIKIRY